MRSLDCDRDCFHCKFKDCWKNGNFRDVNGLGPPVGLNGITAGNQFLRKETEESINRRYAYQIGQPVKVRCLGRACDDEGDTPNGRTATGWRSGVVVGVYPHHVQVRITVPPRGFAATERQYTTSISYAAMASEHCLVAI